MSFYWHIVIKCLGAYYKQWQRQVEALMLGKQHTQYRVMYSSGCPISLDPFLFLFVNSFMVQLVMDQTFNNSSRADLSILEKTYFLWLFLWGGASFHEFWIYSVYGKFYLKLVRGASSHVRPKNPPIFLSVYPPYLCAQKIRAILPSASQSCAVLWRSIISYIYLCTYSSWIE
jgi:hypothetical protein